MTDIAVHGDSVLILVQGRPYSGVIIAEAPISTTTTARGEARVAVEPLSLPSNAALPLLAVFHGPDSQGFLDADRILYVRGDNRAGQLGLPEEIYSDFQRLLFPMPVNQVRMGYGQVVVALLDGAVFRSDPAARTYRRVPVPGRVVDLTLNQDGSYYLTHDGRLYALFHGDPELVEIGLVEQPRRIYGVGQSFFFIAQDGAVFFSDAFPTTDFAQVETPGPVFDLALGDDRRFVALLDEQGTLYTASRLYTDRRFHEVDLNVAVRDIAGSGRWLVFKGEDEQLFLKEL